MRKFLLLMIVVMGVSTSMQAQRSGLQLGVNFSNFVFKAKESGVTLTSKTKRLPGMNVGTIFDWPIALNGQLGLNFGIFYTQNGAKFDADPSFLNESMSMVTHNAMIPVNLEYKFCKGRYTPFIQAGLYGIWTFGATIKVGNDSSSVPFSELNSTIQTFDSGINLGAGADLSSFRLVNYAMGLVNLIPNTDFTGSGSIKSKSISVSVAYFIGNVTKKK